METRKQFALLIDSDNISPRYIEPIITEITTKYGDFSYKRIYGDFTSHNNSSWRNVLLTYSLKPIQQFQNTVGKNATDSSLIIDAMDILYTGNVDGFCIVSSDSDFTSLAQRLGESGRTVIGMGEKKTPASFRNACSLFIVLENLLESDADEVDDVADGTALTKDAIQATIVDIIRGDESRGMPSNLADLGNKLISRYPDFDVRAFGYNQLSKFLKSFKVFDLVPPEAPVTIALKETDVSSDRVKDYIRNEVRSSGDDGCGLAYLGQIIKRDFPGFSVKDAGYSKLSEFLQDIPGVILERDSGDRSILYPAE